MVVVVVMVVVDGRHDEVHIHNRFGNLVESKCLAQVLGACIDRSLVPLFVWPCLVEWMKD